MIRPLWVLTLQMGRFNKAINLNVLLCTQTRAFIEYTKQKRTAFRFAEIRRLLRVFSDKNTQIGLWSIDDSGVSSGRAVPMQWQQISPARKFRWTQRVALLNLKGKTMGLFVCCELDPPAVDHYSDFVCFCLFSFSFVVWSRQLRSDALGPTRVLTHLSLGTSSILSNMSTLSPTNA